MPITLDKLFSRTVSTSFPFMDEVVNVTFAPDRVTGEMYELAAQLEADSEGDTEEIAALREALAETTATVEKLAAAAEPDAERLAELQAEADAATVALRSREIALDQRSKKSIRDMLATLLVGWDVLGADGQPIGTDLPVLNTLPDLFLTTVFLSLNGENLPDPQNAPPSDEPSNTGKDSARSRSGTSSSPRRARSVSPRSSSTNGRTARATTPSGAGGH